MTDIRASIADCKPCMTPTRSPLLPTAIRRRLKLDPRLGAGNFLHHAHAMNPSRAVPLVHSDVPFDALGTTRRALSLTELKDAADRYSAWYLARGIRPLDPVGVYCADGVQYLLQYVALTAIGAIPVLTNGAIDGGSAARYFSRLGVVGIVADRPRYEALVERSDLADLKCFETLEDVPGADLSSLPSWFPYKHDYDAPVMITHSSGTTGAPKAVVLQHGKWFHGIRHLLGLDLPEGADRYLSALPTSHNAAIAYAIHALLTGAEIMLMSSRRGEAVARAIELFRPTTVISFPQTYVELAELEPQAFNFESVSTWLNSGDAAHETHIRRLVAYGRHHRGTEEVAGSQFVDGLGSSEMGHSSFRIIHTPYTNNYDRCVGVPQDWVEPAILDEDGGRVPLGAVGRLGVKSPSITEGYWNDSLLTYRSRVRGYWLTGDLVFRDRFGYYYHVDRISDVVQTHAGPLYSLQTEELILKTQECLADCTIVGVPDRGAQRAIALAVPRNGHDVDLSALLARINAIQADKGRPAIARAHVVEPHEIPLGVTGKVLKRTLRERLAS